MEVPCLKTYCLGFITRNNVTVGVPGKDYPADLETPLRNFQQAWGEDNKQNAFQWACIYGHLEVAKWLLTVDKKVDVRAREDAPFRTACSNGHLEVAKWLLSLDKGVDVRAWRDWAFQWACYNGHLEVAKWLLSLGKGVDVRACDDEAFRWACYNGHLEVVEWLRSLGVDWKS
jgi:ankyrin repeat protein